MNIAARQLQLGPYTLTGTGEAVPYLLAGRVMYTIGTTNGEITPVGAEHLVDEMGGIWAHPIKVAQGLTVALCDTEQELCVPANVNVSEALASVNWRYDVGNLQLQRQDFVVEEQPAFYSLLKLTNPSETPFRGTLHFTMVLRFMGCWFGAMETGGGDYWYEDGLVVGYDRRWQGQWGIACGVSSAGVAVDATVEIERHDQNTHAIFQIPVALEPEQSQSYELLLIAEHQYGHTAAQQRYGNLVGQGETQLAEKTQLYAGHIAGGTLLSTPDEAINRAFVLAKLNLQMLSADYQPHLPAYFLAGIPEYPQLFGCDNEYTIPGAAACGFANTARSSLESLALFGKRSCGRIPHEVTTNGRVFHPGNTQETPQFAQACWDYLRWSGDLTFIEEMYPLCREGVDQYMPALWSGGEYKFYPIGDGVVERHGMGSRKLDSTCYLYQAFQAMEHLSEAVGNSSAAETYRTLGQELALAFEHDWWLPDERMYADSLHTDGAPQLSGHWTVVLPLQMGLASSAQATLAFERIMRDWVNEWGLVHTRVDDERVWTLPTGLLALTAFAFKQPELGVQMLRNIAVTTEHGMLGAFKELIPIGLCFMQLWSAGLYVQGITEGVFGLQPAAHRHHVTISPALPAEWPEARLQHVPIGRHHLDLTVYHDGIDIWHIGGSADLTIDYSLPSTVKQMVSYPDITSPPTIHMDGKTSFLRLSLAPGAHHTVRVTASGVTVQ